MKKIVYLACTALFLSCAAIAQEEANTSNAYEDLLRTTLTDINSEKNPAQLFNHVNKLKRLSAMFPDEWLADYYVALLDIKLSFATKETEKREALLKEAKEKIEALLLKDSAMESEVLTLEGFQYYAQIAMNPQKYGQLYYKEVIGSYQKAQHIDKANPRPVLMMTLFQNKMAGFVGGKAGDICGDLNQIAALFENFTPKDDLHPKWGEKNLNASKKQYCQSAPETVSGK